MLPTNFIETLTFGTPILVVAILAGYILIYFVGCVVFCSLVSESGRQFLSLSLCIVFFGFDRQVDGLTGD